MKLLTRPLSADEQVGVANALATLANTQPHESLGDDEMLCTYCGGMETFNLDASETVFTHDHTCLIRQVWALLSVWGVAPGHREFGECAFYTTPVQAPEPALPRSPQEPVPAPSLPEQPSLTRLADAYNALTRATTALDEARALLDGEYAVMLGSGAYSLRETHARQMANASLHESLHAAGETQQHVNEAAVWRGRQNAGQDTDWR